jgi:hypothetical protein
MGRAAHPHSTTAAEACAATAAEACAATATEVCAATSAKVCAAAASDSSRGRICGAGENGRHGDDSEESDF